MNLDTRRQISWPAIAAEGVAIVASILLAFSIDAWWQRRSELRQAHALELALREDFDANQSQLDEWRAGNARIHRASLQFLQMIRDAERDAEISVPLQLITGVAGAPTYSPTESAWQIATATGEIDFIENDELRGTLARWRQQLADTSEDEILIRDIVVHELIPALSSQVRLGEAFEYQRIMDFFRGQPHAGEHEAVRIRATSALEGALAERVFYATFVVDGLNDIYETQAQILRILDADLKAR